MATFLMMKWHYCDGAKSHRVNGGQRLSTFTGKMESNPPPRNRRSGSVGPGSEGFRSFAACGPPQIARTRKVVGAAEASVCLGDHKQSKHNEEEYMNATKSIRIVVRSASPFNLLVCVGGYCFCQPLEAVLREVRTG